MSDKEKRNIDNQHPGTSFARGIRSERGIALLVVIVLSAVALIIVTALLYMVTSGIQASGLNKGYRSAAEAGLGGVDVVKEVIDLRGDAGLFETELKAVGLNPIITAQTTTCSGVTAEGATYTGLKAKLLTPSDSWSSCDKSLAIDPNVPGSYDMKIELGNTKKYNVYAKITATIEGNSGPPGELDLSGTVSSPENPTKSIPYLYTIETLAESEGAKERAGFSVLYQY